jgi:IPT/TIG domain/S-layer homology domain
MKRPITVFVLSLAVPLSAATFTVTNTNDSGAGSLRDSIEQANTNPGLDTIAFNIPGAGVHTITPGTALPFITGPVMIDGYTQPGTSENTDPIATNAVLLIELDGIVAGGTGLDFGVPGSTIQGLVLNRWVTALHLGGAFAGHVVRGCFFGTDPAGAVRRENSGNIRVQVQATGTVIGGTSPGDRNLISGSLQCCANSGISIGAPNTTIQGNLIGTDATGSFAIPNGIGIAVAAVGGGSILIGGTQPGAGNVISGNTVMGLWITQNPSGVTLHGNRIGTTADGAGPLGNGEGIVYDLGGSSTVVGGVGAGEANVIAHNASRGIVVTFNAGAQNGFRGNSIHDNGGLGIELGDGPIFNDTLDADGGPNLQQNFPIVRQVEHLGPQGNGSTRIVGKFHSAPSTTYDLDFYANPACSNFPREFIEGQTYLGSSEITTDGSGDATFDETFPIQTEAGARIAVTATDPNRNTSEFSQRIIFSISPVSGPDTGGTGFTVAGTDFAGPTTITVGGIPATGVTFVNDHQLTATMPTFAPGTSHDVVVETPDGTTGTLIKGWVSDFLDVPQAHLFHDFVVTLVSNGITVGVGGGLYGVTQDTLRQQMAVFLLRSKYGLCFVPPPCTVQVFDDVPCASIFAPWINELVAQGITGGCGGGTSYCPTNPVLRQQMAVLLLRTLEGTAYTPPACTVETFSDVPCSSPFAPWIYELVARNITAGCGGGLYCPTLAANRGQMATFLVKTFNLQ